MKNVDYFGAATVESEERHEKTTTMKADNCARAHINIEKTETCKIHQQHCKKAQKFLSFFMNPPHIETLIHEKRTKRIECQRMRRDR